MNLGFPAYHLGQKREKRGPEGYKSREQTIIPLKIHSETIKNVFYGLLWYPMQSR
jgi:hypothetical protein